MKSANPLDRDILLEHRSIHGKNAHILERTEYVAQKHQVVRSTVCTRRRWLRILQPKISRTCSVLEIPKEITNLEALESYVRKHRPHWMRGRR